MALNPGTTASDITAALVTKRTSEGRATSSQEQAEMTAYWTDIINALYNRIKADMVVTTKIEIGQTVLIPATSAPGTASNGATNEAWTGVADAANGGIA